MPRYTILEHDHPFLHWDLMLEDGDALRTWRLLARPDLQSVIEAEQLPDHRIAYLNYEGPVSGNRGCVHQWDAGTFDVLLQNESNLTLELRGRILQQTVRLKHVEGHAWSFERNPTG